MATLTWEIREGFLKEVTFKLLSEGQGARLQR